MPALSRRSPAASASLPGPGRAPQRPRTATDPEPGDQTTAPGAGNDTDPRDRQAGPKPRRHRPKTDSRPETP
ncbi:hypothetical protein GCM10010377_64960 [Streptomyces viridiviolaceus]|nr:hypothetical protein GCM10010377_64960 [Streptomyces viridiviolaceus]